VFRLGFEVEGLRFWKQRSGMRVKSLGSRSYYIGFEV
jgi:hypothetical protein